jgi:hypothetical protein
MLTTPPPSPEGKISAQNAPFRCEISYEIAILRNFNTLKVLKPFSQVEILILFILTDVADNDSKFTLVGYGEDSYAPSV